jgi:hypothetical protein
LAEVGYGCLRCLTISVALSFATVPFIRVSIGDGRSKVSVKPACKNASKVLFAGLLLQTLLLRFEGL